jgi:hypothetical protein
MSAVFSPCGQYRLRLERVVGMEGPVYAFFGVNPSYAGPTVNDQTVGKWIGFTKLWGASRFIVGNAFAYKATDVRELAMAGDPIGAQNDQHLAAIAHEADILVPCWGNRSKVPRTLRARFDAVLGLLRATGKPIKAFGFTMSGDPLHPLMLGYDTALIDWPADVKEGDRA